MTCAFAVRGALKKFDGVESVDVSLNKGLAIVKLKPGNNLRPEQFWEAVRKNGFTSKDTRVVVRGEVQTGSGKTEIKVAVTNVVYELASDPSVSAELNRETGKTLTIQGLLTPSKEAKNPVPLQVQSIIDKGK